MSGSCSGRCGFVASFPSCQRIGGLVSSTRSARSAEIPNHVVRLGRRQIRVSELGQAQLRDVVASSIAAGRRSPGCRARRGDRSRLGRGRHPTAPVPRDGGATRDHPGSRACCKASARGRSRACAARRDQRVPALSASQARTNHPDARMRVRGRLAGWRQTVGAGRSANRPARRLAPARVTPQEQARRLAGEHVVVPEEQAANVTA